MKYEVRAISGDSIETLVVDAISEDDAARVVGERQLTPLAIRPCMRAAGLFTARSARFDLGLYAVSSQVGRVNEMTRADKPPGLV